MYVIFIAAWILSPFVLIPVLIKKSKESGKLRSFIDELCRLGRISNSEYVSLRAERQSVLSEKENGKPVFADSREFSRVHGGETVRADEKVTGTVPGEKPSAPPVQEKPTVPESSTVTNNGLYDMSFSKYKKTEVRTEKPNAAEKPVFHDADPTAYPTGKAAETKPVRADIPKTASPEKKRAAAMSVLMMIGIVFVILAGLVFSTAVWATLGEIGRTCAVGIISAMFFGISAFTGKKLKLERTSFAFYTLGTFFSAITLITAGFFGLTGTYFSVSGEGARLLYAAALLIICVLSAKGRSLFDIPAAAYISSFSGTLAAVLILAQLSDSIGVFALLAAVLTAVINIFMYVLDIQISDKWEKPLRTVSAVLNGIALISGISAAFGNSPVFYAAAAVFVLRSIIAAVMGFKGRRVYKTGLAAVTSLASGAFFALAVMAKLSSGIEIFALSAAVFAVLFALGMFTFKIEIPECWSVPVKMSAFILNAVGIISAFNALMRNFGEWNGVCFAIAAVYIVSSFAAAVMAVCGHNRYKEAPSAFASMFTGLAFSVMLAAELSASAAVSALSFTVMLLVLVNAVYTLPSKLPDSWKTAVGISAAVLGLISVFGTLFVLIDNFGSWDASCFTVAALYILQAVLVTVLAYRGHSGYFKTRWAALSQLIGIFFTLITLSQLAESEIGFMLYITVFAAAYLNFVHTLGLKKPENWKVPLKVFSYILGIFGILFTVPQMYYHSEWTYHFYVAAVVYIVYSAAVTAMAFFGHSEYSKRYWAVVSQFTGILFIVILLAKFTENDINFMLCLTVFAAVYLNFANTFRVNKPEKWKTPLKAFSYILGILGVIFTAVQMSDNAEWTYQIYLSIAIYIAYSAAAAAMAFFNHGEYSKTRWAIASQLTGIIFSLSVIYKAFASSGAFILIFAAFAVLYSAALSIAFLKLPEKWVRTVNVIDIVFNISAAFTAVLSAVGQFGSWDIYCFLLAFLYIGYTAFRGIRNGNSLLKAAECVISSVAAYNLYCIFEDGNLIVPEFFLVCMMFLISVIHHFVKPVRTLFSDIFLTAGLAVSAVFCALSYNLCGVLGFALLGIVMLIKSAEGDGKISAVFKALLPLPVTGMVFTFVYYNVCASFGTMAAINAVVLAVIAAAIMFIRKKPNSAFLAFAFTSSVLIFFGTSSVLTFMPVILLAASVMLTVLWCRCKNNLPSLLSMAGTAVSVCRLADEISLHTDFNVSLLFAVIFAAVSLAASRVFYGKKLLDRQDGIFRLDTCCAGMLLALPMVRSANENVAAFAVLSILAAFAANLARKDHEDNANRVAATLGCGLFTLALIFRPFLTVSEVMFSRKITLAIICVFGFVFSKIWAKYPKLAENFSSAVYGISFVCLITDALANQNLFNTLVVLGTSALILLYSFISKKKRWFAVSSVSLLGLTVYTFRDFFTMIDWWVYLLIVGFILIAVSAANEYFVRKGREFKEKAGRFFEDWKW